MQKDYLRLKRTFNIERIYSVHYFELPKTYTIPGKEHDFWEFVYVDKGEIIVTTDEKEFVLHAKIRVVSPGGLEHLLDCSSRIPLQDIEPGTISRAAGIAVSEIVNQLKKVR